MMMTMMTNGGRAVNGVKREARTGIGRDLKDLVTFIFAVFIS